MHPPEVVLHEVECHGCGVVSIFFENAFVGGVKRRTVVGANCRRDAALRVSRVAFGRVGLRQNQDPAHRGERDRRTESCDAAANDDEVEEV